jgi:hypothetical protein
MGTALLDAPNGTLYPVVTRDPRMEWGLNYAVQGLNGDVLAILKYARGHAMVLIPDDDATRTMPHLVYLHGDVDQTQMAEDLYSISVRLIEQPSPAVEDYAVQGGGG